MVNMRSNRVRYDFPTKWECFGQNQFKIYLLKYVQIKVARNSILCEKSKLDLSTMKIGKLSGRVRSDLSPAWYKFWQSKKLLWMTPIFLKI